MGFLRSTTKNSHMSGMRNDNTPLKTIAEVDAALEALYTPHKTTLGFCIERQGLAVFTASPPLPPYTMDYREYLEKMRTLEASITPLDMEVKHAEVDLDHTRKVHKARVDEGFGGGELTRYINDIQKSESRLAAAQYAFGAARNHLWDLVFKTQPVNGKRFKKSVADLITTRIELKAAERRAEIEAMMLAVKDEQQDKE
jgi:hypothetical protein